MGKSSKNRADWSNYWRGRTAGDTGEVFAGVGIETSDELIAIWRAAFAEIGDARVLDIACGAGSALKHADAAGAPALFALDISEHAVASACSTVPRALGVVASADRLPFPDGALDRVVSQFGFEYANREAAAREVARVLKPGGRFQAIVHLSGGAIARECSGHLQHLNRVRDSRFIPATKDLFASLFKADTDKTGPAQSALQGALKVFGAAQTHLMPAVQAGGLAAHLHGGARQLYERRKGYSEADITGWLDGMAAEIDAYRGRMEGMLGAAIGAEEAGDLARMIQGGAGHGGNGARVEPLELGGEAAALWIEAVREG
ncbi:MAG: class I SAM-dependent methyltransferase [Pseudomonadota bacterium]